MCRYQTGSWNLYVLFTEGTGADPRVMPDRGGGGWGVGRSCFPQKKTNLDHM